MAFNTAEGWSRDVTEDIARALLEQETREGDLSEFAKTFVERVLKLHRFADGLPNDTR